MDKRTSKRGLGKEMRTADEKVVKETKDRLQTRFNKEQAMANPLHGKAFQREVL